MIPLMISNMAAGNVAIHFGLKGKCINVVTACATGTHSIGEAVRAIQCGDADVMVAGGTEAAICPLGIGGFGALTALSTSEDPLAASLPFDKRRGGFVMGEGAGVVVLESYEHAQARGAQILAEVGGYGATCDAYHITSPCEDGEGAARAMQLINGQYSNGDMEMFREIYDSLLNTNCSDRADTYFILADFKSYAEAQKRVEEAYRDEERWARMAMLNMACSGKFTSDRTIQQYVDEIWHLDHEVIKVDPETFEA